MNNKCHFAVAFERISHVLGIKIYVYIYRKFINEMRVGVNVKYRDQQNCMGVSRCRSHWIWTEQGDGYCLRGNSTHTKKISTCACSLKLELATALVKIPTLLSRH